MRSRRREQFILTIVLTAGLLVMTTLANPALKTVSPVEATCTLSLVAFTLAMMWIPFLIIRRNK